MILYLTGRSREKKRRGVETKWEERWQSREEIREEERRKQTNKHNYKIFKAAIVNALL